MHVMRRLFDEYGEDMLAFPNLSSRLASLLRDPQDSIRQLAVEILGKLFEYRGEELMVCNLFIYLLYYDRAMY